MAIKILTDKNFDDVVSQSEIPVLVDFYADWCKPCMKLVPTMEEIAAEKDGEILVCKVDVDKYQSIAATYQVMSIPNIIAFKNGKVYKRVLGAVSKDELLELVE